MLLRCQEVRLPRQTVGLDRHFIKTTVSFLEDGVVRWGIWRWSVRMVRPEKKKCVFVGMQVRNAMAMELGSVKQEGANSIEIKEVLSADRMTA